MKHAYFFILYAIQKCVMLTAFQYLKGPTRKVEVDFLQEHVVTGQGERLQAERK